MDADRTDRSSPSAAAVRTRLALRLVHLVGLPSSRVAPSERHVIADLIVEVLSDADAELRKRCAQRVIGLVEPPSALVRLLARDEPDIARILLEECDAISDADLAATAHAGRIEHRVLVAGRKHVPELVAAAAASYREPDVIERLLRNTGAQLPSAALEQIVADSRREPRFVPLLTGRRELRPDLALNMFWWAEAKERLAILRRFAVERTILQEAVSDVFSAAAAEGWSDPITRRALQFIERRQRNRAALSRSPFDSLEEAVEAVAQCGLTRELTDEASYLSGLKPAIGARILNDVGGEPVAVLCKAVGLKRPAVRTLWQGLDRRRATEGADAAMLERTIAVFDMLSVDKAQTVLRYWNWSLSSASASSLAGAPDRGADEALVNELTPAERAALMALAAPA